MQLWKDWLCKLEKQWGAAPVNQWLRSLKIVRFDAANLYLQAQDSFQVAWFEEHIRPLLRENFCNQNLRPIKVHLILQETSSPQASPPPVSSFTLAPDALDPEMTFSSYLSPNAQNIPLDLLQELHQATPFNPLFLYGPNGCGKTHLLHATVRHLQSQKIRCFFVQAETFTEHVVQAIRLSRMQEFRKIYRSADALLIDDIHLFARKFATQEEFFHTFNTLHTLGKPIVLTSICAPSQLEEIEPRLMSRFEWGLSLPLAPCNPEDLLKQKSTLWQFPLSSEIKQWLLQTFPLNPLLAFRALTIRAKHSPSPKEAHTLLQDLIEKEAKQSLTADKLIQWTVLHFGIRTEDLLGDSKVREFSFPRQILIYLLREKLHWTYQQIGKLLNKDHSTILGSYKQVQKGLQEEKNTKWKEEISRVLSRGR